MGLLYEYNNQVNQTYTYEINNVSLLEDGPILDKTGILSVDNASPDRQTWQNYLKESRNPMIQEKNYLKRVTCQNGHLVK